MITSLFVGVDYFLATTVLPRYYFIYVFGGQPDAGVSGMCNVAPRIRLCVILIAIVLTVTSGCGQAEAERMSKEIELHKAELSKAQADLKHAQAEIERLSSWGPDGLDSAGVLTQSGDFSSGKFVEWKEGRGNVYEIMFPRGYVAPPTISISQRTGTEANFQAEVIETKPDGFRYISLNKPSEPIGQQARWRARGMAR